MSVCLIIYNSSLELEMLLFLDTYMYVERMKIEFEIRQFDKSHFFGQFWQLRATPHHHHTQNSKSRSLQTWTIFPHTKCNLTWTCWSNYTTGRNSLTPHTIHMNARTPYRHNTQHHSMCIELSWAELETVCIDLANVLAALCCLSVMCAIKFKSNAIILWYLRRYSRCVCRFFSYSVFFFFFSSCCCSLQFSLFLFIFFISSSLSERQSVDSRIELLFKRVCRCVCACMCMWWLIVYWKQSSEMWLARGIDWEFKAPNI